MTGRPFRLGRLLRPSHIAAFGGGWAEQVVDQCNKMGFDGDVWPVHPSKETVHGRKCYRSVDDLPCAPDASFVGVNRNLTPSILTRLSERGAGGAVCFASGFAEAEKEDQTGAELQAELLKAAGEMPFLGPNCYGLINFLEGAPIWPDQHGGKVCGSGAAILTQSSNLAINISMQARGLPISYLVTSGNQASVTQCEVAKELLDDDRVTAIGLHIESLSPASHYEELADFARRRRKPIIAIKAGSSPEAREAAVSHTGAMAGSDAYASALFKRLGIARVGSISVLIEALKILHVGGPLAGRNVCSLSCSGGEACLMADAAEPTSLRFGELKPSQTEKLREALGPMVHLANPLDYHTYQWGNEPALRRIFSAMLSGGYDFGFLVMDFPRADRCADAQWEPAANAIEQSCRDTGIRTAVVSCLPENLSETWSERFMERGIVPLHGIPEAIEAAEAAAEIGECWAAPKPPPIQKVQSNAGPIRTMDEAEAKTALKAHSVPVPYGATAPDAAAVADAAERIGYPVVLKALAFQHKTEANAVAVNLASRQAVETALAAMPDENGFLVEQFITDPVAEMLIGAMRESEGQGLMLTVGAGGVWTELMADAQFLLLPTTRGEVEAALKRLRIWKLLAGYRGGKAADVDALVTAAMSLADFALARADNLIEAEINPYLALPSGGFAVDALIREVENE